MLCGVSKRMASAIFCHKWHNAHTTTGMLGTEIPTYCLLNWLYCITMEDQSKHNLLQQIWSESRSILHNNQTGWGNVSVSASQKWLHSLQLKCSNGSKTNTWSPTLVHPSHVDFTIKTFEVPAREHTSGPTPQPIVTGCWRCTSVITASKYDEVYLFITGMHNSSVLLPARLTYQAAYEISTHHFTNQASSYDKHLIWFRTTSVTSKSRQS